MAPADARVPRDPATLGTPRDPRDGPSGHWVKDQGDKDQMTITCTGPLGHDNGTRRGPGRNVELEAQAQKFGVPERQEKKRRF